MSLISGITRSNGSNGVDKVLTPPQVSAYAPKPKPHQLGTFTLEAVDQLTGMSADEIEKVAEQVLDAAQETANALRDAADRVRESGLRANELLANFVKVATACADAARMMQGSIAHRNDPPPPEEETRIEQPTDLETLAAQITDVANGGNGSAR